MKVFRDPPAAHEQLMLLPASVGDYVSENAPVRVFSEVMDCLDTSALYAPYRGGGAPAYDPLMLAKVLIYGLSIGLRGSRRLAQALECDLRFIWLSHMSKPDFRTLCRFRRQNEKALRALFRESVRFCQTEGLVLLSEVAVDGTKLEANVSGKETYQAARLPETMAKVDAKIGNILQEAEDTDSAEDTRLGEARGDEVPKALSGLKRRKERLARAMEEAAKTNAASVAATDLDSRLMKTRAGNRPAYNAQAAVDGANQIIVAAEVTQDTTDAANLEPMVEQVQHNTGEAPDKVLADGGYQSVEALAYAERSGLDVYIAQTTTGSHAAECAYDAEADCYTDAHGNAYPYQRDRVRRRTLYRVYRCPNTRKELWIRQDGKLLEAMRAKLRTREGKAIYRRRQQIVEPVFGQMKGTPNLRRLLLRGLAGARVEFMLACVSHNLLKAVRYRIAAMAPAMA